MAVFSSGGGSARSADGQSPSGGEGSLSIIAAGLTVVGELTTDGVVKVEGTLEGSVRAERQVLIARGGVVVGDVYTKEAIVGGRVAGSIYAEERVEVQSNSTVEGDIVTKRLLVQEGGEVNGHVQMGARAQSKPPERSPGEPASPGPETFSPSVSAVSPPES